MPRTRTSARRPPASATSRAGSAGRRRPSARPATTATAGRGATRRCASANIPGARAKEDYVLPDAHTVAIRIAPEQLAGVTGDCIWSWQPRKAGGKAETQAACLQGQAHHRARAVFARPRAVRRRGHGEAAGRPRARRARVVVEDLFIVALGDSFASGESNPDRPVHVQRRREMVYDPDAACDEDRRARASAEARRQPGLRSGVGRPTVQSEGAAAALHGRRGGRALLQARSRADSRAAFEKARRAGSAATATARNTAIRSASAIQLALENRHRSVTLASFACSGAEVAEGLFREMIRAKGSDEGPRAVRPVERADLPRRRARRARATRCRCSRTAAPQIARAAVHQGLVPAGAAQAADRRRADVDRRQRRRLRRARRLCDDRERRRPRADRRAGRRQIRFGPQVSRVYLEVLDERMKAVKDALHDGFGVRRRAWCSPPTSRSSTTRPARSAARSRRSASTCIPS